MRTTYTILLACLLTLAFPLAAADDPTYDVPDPTQPAGDAEQFATGTATGADALATAVVENATGAAEDLTSATFPAGRAANITSAAAEFGTDSVGRADTFSAAATGWTLATVEQKREEAFATVDATLGVAISAINAGSAIAGAAADAVCSKPLINDLLGDQCGENSVVNATRDEVSRFGEETAEEAAHDRTVGLIDAVRDFLGNFVSLPPA